MNQLRSLIRPMSLVPDTNICLFRVLFCTALAITVAVTLPYYAVMHRDFVYTPVPLFRAFGDWVPGMAAFMIMGGSLVPLLLLAACGLFTRATLLVSALIYFVFFSFQLGFTRPLSGDYTYHIKNLGFFVLLILAFAPNIGRYTIRNFRTGIEEQMISSWPQLLVLSGLGAAYFGSGYCKMMNDPLWVDGYTVQANILRQYLRRDLGLSLLIAQSNPMNVVASVIVTFIELTFFIGVLVARVRWLYVLAGLGFHLMIYLTMRVNFFPYFSIVYLVMIEWRHVALVMRRFGLARKQSSSALPPGGGGVKPVTKLALVAFAIVCFVGPVLARIESWPFSDYRVFTKRNHPERIGIYRHGGERADGEFRWVSVWWQQELTRRYDRHLHQAFGKGDEEKIMELAQKAYADLPEEVRSEYKTFRLVRRWIRPSKEAGKNWRMKEAVVAEFPTSGS